MEALTYTQAAKSRENNSTDNKLFDGSYLSFSENSRLPPCPLVIGCLDALEQ